MSATLYLIYKKTSMVLHSLLHQVCMSGELPITAATYLI